MKKSIFLLVMIISVIFPARSQYGTVLPEDGEVLAYDDFPIYRGKWKVYIINNDNPDSLLGHIYAPEKILYDFTLQPGESYMSGEEEIIITGREQINYLGKQRISLTTNKGKMISGIGWSEYGFFDTPYFNREDIDIDPAAITPSYCFYALFTLQGMFLGADTNGWYVYDGHEREFLPILVANRIWEYEGDQGNMVYYTLDAEIPVAGELYYPVYRSEKIDFSDKILMGYMQESKGQVFYRPCNFSKIPANEITYINFGEKTILYDMNVQKDLDLLYSAKTHAYGGWLPIKSVEDIEYDGTIRKFVKGGYGNYCEYMEGIGAVNNGTFAFPRLVGSLAVDDNSSKTFNLKRLTDNGKVIFDRDDSPLFVLPIECHQDFKSWAEDGIILTSGESAAGVAVFTPEGYMVYKGPGGRIENLQKGLYIVKSGNVAVKVVL